MKKYDVLIVMDYYLPGRLSGGPVTTIEGFTEKLGSNLRFLVITHNYDIDNNKYKNLVEKEYYTVGNADVIYVNDPDFNPRFIDRLVNKHHINYIYFNSFFSRKTIFCLMRNKFRKFDSHIVLAPRGEFSEGALSIHYWKKHVYLKLFLIFNLQRNITFQASNAIEKDAITKEFRDAYIKIASDIPVMQDGIEGRISFGLPKVVFISRIVPMKNLDFALNILAKMTESILFHIYGPVEDKNYWEKCKNLINSMPKNITVEYQGILDHSDVSETFKEYDVFLIPSLGENFGHVIFESLAAGCPVIVSDKTPWLDLENAGVGWVVPLKHPEGFASAIREVVSATEKQKTERSVRCIEYAYRASRNEEVIADNYRLFGHDHLGKAKINDGEVE